MIKELIIEKTSLPIGWEIKKLANVLNIQNGYAFNSKLFSAESGTPLIRIRDIKKGINTVTNYTGEYDKKYEVNSGDFLIGMDGEFGCYEWKGEVALLNQRVCRLQDFNEIDSKFLFYGINKYLKDIEDVTTFTTVKHISSSQIKNIEFPLPPLTQQKQIVAILDKAFAVIDTAKANAEQNLKNAKELFESYLQNIFENKVDDWEEKTISLLVDDKVLDKPLDGNHGETHPVKSDFIDFGVPFIMSKDLVDGGVNQKTCHFISREQADSLRKGFAINDDVLLTHKGTIGRVAILKTDLDYVMLTPQVTYYRILNKKELYNRYLFYYLKSPNFQKPMKEIAGIGSTRAYIGITKQRELTIRYPNNLSLQKDIVKKLDKLSIETKKLEAIYIQKVADLEELKKSVLQKAFSGELNTIN
jgi:type I restriction enzyme, S subunit